MMAEQARTLEDRYHALRAEHNELQRAHRALEQRFSQCNYDRAYWQISYETLVERVGGAAAFCDPGRGEACGQCLLCLRRAMNRITDALRASNIATHADIPPPRAAEPDPLATTGAARRLTLPGATPSVDAAPAASEDELEDIITTPPWDVPNWVIGGGN